MEMDKQTENTMDDHFFLSFLIFHVGGNISLEGTTAPVSNYSFECVGCKYWNLGLLNACVTNHKMLQVGRTPGGCFCFPLLNTSPARSDCSALWPAMFWTAPRMQNLCPWDLPVMGTFHFGEKKLFLRSHGSAQCRILCLLPLTLSLCISGKSLSPSFLSPPMRLLKTAVRSLLTFCFNPTLKIITYHKEI